MIDHTPADLAGETSLELARAIEATDGTCRVCGAEPGAECRPSELGPPPLPLGHGGRREAALEQALARALLWVDEFRGLAAIADRLDGPVTAAELDRILAPDIRDYLTGNA